MSRFAIAALLLLASTGAAAVEVMRIEVGEDGRSYYVRYEARLAADAAAVMRVLTDYPSYPSLDARIRESGLVGHEDGMPILRTRLDGCLGFVFCRTMERYERLEESPTRLVATAIPGRGDMVSGRTETRVQPRAGGCRVSYVTEFEPSFWMPRWLVRRAMRETLREGTLAMFEAVEARAAREAAK